MGDTRDEEYTRIVWATDEAEVERLCREEFEQDDPYGINKWVGWIVCNPALGTPEIN